MEENLFFGEFESGDLPPTGSIAEKCYNSPTLEYFRVKILAHENGFAVFRWLEGPHSGELDESENFLNHKGTNCECYAFRPARSHKEKVIEKAREALKGFDIHPEAYHCLYITGCLRLPD